MQKSCVHICKNVFSFQAVDRCAAAWLALGSAFRFYYSQKPGTKFVWYTGYVACVCIVCMLVWRFSAAPKWHASPLVCPGTRVWKVTAFSSAALLEILLRCLLLVPERGENRMSVVCVRACVRACLREKDHCSVVVHARSIVFCMCTCLRG